MLKLADIIRAPKSSIMVGEWRSGKIPTSVFPLKKKGMLPQSSAWKWRTVEFAALGRDFVLLIRPNLEAEYYSSMLAMKANQQIQVLCHHEFHSSHRGWHCHFVPNNVEDTFPGVLRDKIRMRVFDPKPSERDDRAFDVRPETALTIAGGRFRFAAPDETPEQYPLL